jgi:hypothetical protein
MEERTQPGAGRGPDDHGGSSRVTQSASTVADALHPADSDHGDPAAAGQHGPFGALLEPVIRRACQDRLSHVNWFRTDWQRGGAATGYATFTDDDGQAREVVVKLPVPPRERQWLVQLQPRDAAQAEVAPRLLAHGESLNGYDMAWVVMERLPHGPLGLSWGGAEFDLLVEAAGRFYQATRELPLKGEPDHKDWDAIYDQARKHVQQRDITHPQRWREALKKAHRKLKEWVHIWRQRPCADWCHGDLHLGNALTRVPAPDGPALLIDFANTRPGCWVEDAIYFEHLFWARKDRLNGRKLAKQLAHIRKERGLPVASDWAHYAQAKRALLAMSTPAQLRHDGDPAHVQAALEVLETQV